MTIVPLVVGYFAIQWNRGNYLGKSPEQIVAMGRDKWAELYGKKFGESTASVSDAQEKYGIALQNLNDRAMTRLPSTRQHWLKDVRRTTTEYATEAHSIGSIVTGGGTIWRTFDATILPDVEQAISDCILKKPISKVHSKSFELEFQSLDKVIASIKASASPDDIVELGKHRNQLLTKHAKLMNLLTKGPAHDSGRIQSYMHRKIEVARGEDA